MEKLYKFYSQYKKLIFLILLFFFLILSIIFAFSFLSQNEKSFESDTTAMGTYIQQTVYGKDSELACINATGAIKELENKISWKINGSLVDQINQNANENWVKLDQETLDILEISLKVSEKSSRSFDLTLLPISSLWKFDANINYVPTETELAARLSLVNYKNLKINKDTMRAKLFNVKGGIDLDSVANGAAVNSVLEVYKKLNIYCGIVSVGSSMGVYGKKRNGNYWNLAIKDPLNAQIENSRFAIVSLEEGCISTSGAYEKNFSKDGKFYHHILDPKTGNPVQNNLLCVSVIHKSGIVTSLLSRALYVLGKEKSKPILDFFGAEAIFVEKDRSVYITEKLKNKINLTNKDYTLCQWD